jgi:hypothetical protein
MLGEIRDLKTLATLAANHNDLESNQVSLILIL